MGIGVSVFLIAVGAILAFAVHATVSGISVQAVGVILMIAGALGLAVTMTIFAPRRSSTVVERRTVEADPFVTAPSRGSTVATERVVEHHDVY